MPRPSTSKPRGLCRYYKDPRGCYAGDNCKFLHADALPGPSDTPLLTPYDKSKRCKFYEQGYCKRGGSCWFLHIDDDRIQKSDEDEPLCSICFEKPTTYGLLINCSHIFCIECIKQWRDPKGKPSDTISSGSIKSCPMCRTSSTSIIPSSRFYSHKSEGRTRIVQQYRESTGRVDCRYFQKSLEKYPDKPMCPFGGECMYRHRTQDGTIVLLKENASSSMRRYHTSMTARRPFFSDYFWSHIFPESTAEISAAIMQHVQTLRTDAEAEETIGDDILESIDAIGPGMEEATRRTEAAMHTMELISDALVSAGRQRLDMRSVVEQFQRIRNELVGRGQSVDAEENADRNLDEELDAARRRASEGTRAMRYVHELGGLADEMLASINGVLNADLDNDGAPDLIAPGILVPTRRNSEASEPDILNDPTSAVASGSEPGAAQNASRDSVRSRILSMGTRGHPFMAALGPITIMRHLPPFSQGVPVTVPVEAGSTAPNPSVELGIALTSASVIINLTGDAMRADIRAREILATARTGSQSATEAGALLAEAQAVIPVLRAELQTAKTTLENMEYEYESPQQQLLIIEKLEALSGLIESIDAREINDWDRSGTRRPDPPVAVPAADGSNDGGDDMPGLQSVSSSSEDDDDEDDADDSDSEFEDPELEANAIRILAAFNGETFDSGALASIMRDLERGETADGPHEDVNAPQTAAAGVTSSRFSTVVDRTPSTSGRTSPPLRSTDSGSRSALLQAPLLSRTEVLSESAVPAVDASSSSLSPSTTHYTGVSARSALEANAAVINQLPLAAAPTPKAIPTRRTSGDFTTDGRGRVISIGGGGNSREGLHWPSEAPAEAHPARPEVTDEDDDVDGKVDVKRMIPPVQSKISEFTTDGRGRVISVGGATSAADASSHPGESGDSTPSSASGGLLGWFGSFF